MSALPLNSERPPLQTGFRRSFTLPTRQLSVHEKAGLDSADANADILYTHPTAKIVSFSPPTESIKSTSKAEIPADTDYPVDTVETLPWRSRSESLAASGVMLIEKVRGSTNFLKCQSVMHAILRNSQCWCVDGESKFVLRVRKFQYYRIELPSSSGEDKAKVEELKKVLPTVLRYERTPCPFIRAFTVDLPDDAITPRRKGQWKRRDSSQSNTPDSDTPALRRSKPTRSWSVKSPPTSYPKSGPGYSIDGERGRPGSSGGFYRRSSLFDSYRNSSPASYVASEDGTDSDGPMGSEHDSAVQSTPDRSTTTSPHPEPETTTASSRTNKEDEQVETSASKIQPTKETAPSTSELDADAVNEECNTSSAADQSFEEPSDGSRTVAQESGRVADSADAGAARFYTSSASDSDMELSAQRDLGDSHPASGTREDDNHPTTVSVDRGGMDMIADQGPTSNTATMTGGRGEEIENSEVPKSQNDSFSPLASAPGVQQADPEGLPEAGVLNQVQQDIEVKEQPTVGSESMSGASRRLSSSSQYTPLQSVEVPVLDLFVSPFDPPTSTNDIAMLFNADNVYEDLLRGSLNSPTMNDSELPDSLHLADTMDDDMIGDEIENLSPVSSVASFHTSTSASQRPSHRGSIESRSSDINQYNQYNHSYAGHKREVSEMTITASSIFDTGFREDDPSTQDVLESEDSHLHSRSAQPDALCSQSETSISTVQESDGVRQRTNILRSFSPPPPASTIFTGSRIRHDSGSGHMTKAILQKIIVTPIEVAIFVVHILARIASGATVNDLLSGELFKRPEHRRRVSGFADQLAGSETEDDFGVPVRGQRRTNARQSATIGTEAVDEAEDVD